MSDDEDEKPEPLPIIPLEDVVKQRKGEHYPLSDPRPEWPPTKPADGEDD